MQVSLDAGYATYPDVFTRSEADAVLAALPAGTRRTKAGARHLLSVPPVSDVANDPRMVAIAAEGLGHAAVPFRATLFDKSPGANWLVAWHQDTALPLRSRIEDPAWGPWSIKSGVLYAHAPAWALERVVALRLSLDDSTHLNGPLRVLPGSHRGGVLTAEQIEHAALSGTPTDCVVPAGGVVAMRPLILRASSKSVTNRPRRVLHIEYATSLVIGDGVELVTC